MLVTFAVNLFLKYMGNREITKIGQLKKSKVNNIFIPKFSCKSKVYMIQGVLKNNVCTYCK
jgi:hypothetical protein